METIIPQIAAKMVDEFLENMRKNGIRDIGQTAHQLLEIAKSSITEIISVVIEQMDMALVNANQARREDGLRIKEKNVPRALLTVAGEVRYRRTYFETKDNQRYYLVDHLVGVEPYERLTKKLCAELVQAAADKSMAAATKELQVDVSRQTVNNKVLALKEVVIEATREKETPKELHLFADEDHVHLKNGHNAVVPLITVTEGVDASKKRHKTINAVHFEGYGISNDSFFENIASFLEERYNMEQVDTVYVHADGGQWIRKAEEWLPNVRFVMDGFHLEKRLRQISRLEGAAPYMGAIRKSISEDRFDRFASYCVKISKHLDEYGRKILANNIHFIRNHWDAIVLRMRNQVCGSCTEPLVSHVLSKRLSRNPLAWSDHGLRQMAMLRVYVKNGGIVTEKDIRVSRSKADLDRDRAALQSGFAKYRAYADKQIDEFLSHKPDWSIFEKSYVRSGRLDGTRMLLKALGSVRDTVASA